jgi:hypothetical protein
MPPKDGHWPPQPNHGNPFHDHHMQHFEQALQDALRDWPERDVAGIEVKFVADFSANPGGVSQYHVQLVGGP